MKPGIKQDLRFALTATILLTGYIAAGFAMGYVKFTHVADVILTPWSMIGLGSLVVAAILYQAVKTERSKARALGPNQEVLQDSYLSGKTVVIVVTIALFAIVAVVAYTVLADL
jgi:nucleoside permease NupC